MLISLHHFVKWSNKMINRKNYYYRYNQPSKVDGIIYQNKVQPPKGFNMYAVIRTLLISLLILSGSVVAAVEQKVTTRPEAELILNQLKAFQEFDPANVYQKQLDTIQLRFLGEINRILSADLDIQTCSISGGEPNLTKTTIGHNFSDTWQQDLSAIIGQRIDQLIKDDYVYLSMLLEQVILEQNVLEGLSQTPAQKKLVCNTIKTQVAAIECFAKGGTDCVSNYNSAIEQQGEILAANFFINEKSLFNELKVFLSYNIKPALQSAIAKANSLQEAYENIYAALIAHFETSIEQYTNYVTTHSVISTLKDYEEEYLALADIKKAEIDAAYKEMQVLEKAASEYSVADAEYMAAKMTTEYLSQHIGQNLAEWVRFKDDLLTKLEIFASSAEVLISAVNETELKEKLREHIKKQVDHKLRSDDVEKALNDGINQIFYFEGVPNGQTLNGRALYDVKLFVAKRENNASFDFGELPPKTDREYDFQPGDVDRVSADEKTYLGLIVRNVERKPDGTYKSHRIGAALNVSVDPEFTNAKLEEALAAMGVPVSIPIRDFDFRISEDLKNFSYEMTVNPFGNGYAVESFELLIVKDGKLRPLETIAKEFKDESLKVVKPHAQKWLESFPVVQDAQGAVNGLVALVTSTDLDIAFDSEDRLVLTAPIKIKSSFESIPDVDYSVKLIVTRNGVIMRGDDLPYPLVEAVEKILTKKAKEIAGSKAELISHVTPILEIVDNVLSLSATIGISAEALGCRIDANVTTTFPFDQLVDDITGEIGQIGTRAASCDAANKLNELVSSIQDSKVKFFGYDVSLGEFSGCAASSCSVSLLVEHATGSMTVKKVIAGLQGAQVKLDLSEAEWDENQAGKFIAAELRGLFGAVDNYLKISKPKLSKRGFSFEADLTNIPYVGHLDLGRIFVNKIDFNSLEVVVRDTIRNRINKEITDFVARNGNIPDVGPIKNPTPVVTMGGAFSLGMNAQIEVVDQLLPIEIQLLPEFKFKFDAAGAGRGILQSVISSIIPLKIGVVEIKEPLVTRFAHLGLWGLKTGIKLDMDILKIEASGIGVTTKGVVFPDSIGGSVNAPISVGPVVIANPGFSYHFKPKGFGISGDITVFASEIEKLVKIDGEITLKGLESLKDLHFELKGNLIAADSLALYTTTGEVHFRNQTITYRSGTNPMLKALIETRNDGDFDGRQKEASTRSSMRILGVKLSENEFKISVHGEKKDASDATSVISLMGEQGFGIGSWFYKVGSDLEFKKPEGAGGINIRLMGWDVLKGHIEASTSKTQLDFKALVFDITVIAPAIYKITPDLLLRTLADLLKIDIKSLLKKPELKKIVVNLLESNGKVTSADTAPPSSGGGEGSIDPSGLESAYESAGNDLALRAPAGLPPEVPVGKGTDSPIKGDYKGYLACGEEIPKGYELRNVPALEDKYFLDFGDAGQDIFYRWLNCCDQVTMQEDIVFKPQKGTQPFCKNTREVNGTEWRLIRTPTVRHFYPGRGSYQCDPETGELMLGQAEYTSNSKPVVNFEGQGMFCGTITSDSSSRFKANEKILYKKDQEVDSGGFFSEVDQSQIKNILAAINRQLKEDTEQFLADNSSIRTAIDGLTKNGTPIINSSKTRFVHKATCKLWPDDYCNKFDIYLNVYSEPKSKLHHWIQSTMLIANVNASAGKKGFWALSRCEPEEISKNEGFQLDDAYIEGCVDNLFFLAPFDFFGWSEAKLQENIQKKDFALTPFENYFLREKMAKPIIKGQQPAQKPVESFEYLHYKTRQKKHAQVMKTPGSLEFYVTKLESEYPISAALPTVSQNDSDLYHWLDKHIFREKVLSVYEYDKDASVLYQYENGSKKQLVLMLFKEGNPKEAHTIWIYQQGGAVKSKRVIIDLVNPYTGYGIPRSAQKEMIKRYFDVITSSNVERLSFGASKNTNQEITIFTASGTLNIYKKPYSRSGNFDVTSPLGSSDPIAFDKLAVCLKNTSTNRLNESDLYRVLGSPDSYLDNGTVAMHPYVLLNLPGCK